MSSQLTLPIRLNNDFTFTNYYAGRNQAIIAYLQSLKFDGYSYLWGGPGTGCTHLLQATCHLAQKNNISAIYLSLAQIINLNTAILENLESMTIVCLDDIAVIAGNSKWEEAVFDLFNRCQMNNSHLMISGQTAPKELNIQLPDLLSRLNSGIILHIHELSDQEKIAALQLQAKYRGLELSDETSQFLLAHLPRDLSNLFSCLEKLDQCSLAEQRKLTIPFVKKVLFSHNYSRG